MGGEREHIEKARQGDAQAFDTLLRACPYAMLSVLRASQLPPEEREDVLQESVLNAWRNIASFQGSSLGAWSKWLQVITKNALLNYLRTRNHRRQNETGILDGRSQEASESEVLPQNTSIEADIEEEDFHTFLCVRMTAKFVEKHLRAEDIRLFTYHILEGKTFKEIAELIGGAEMQHRNRWNEALVPALNEVHLDLAFQDLPRGVWGSADYQLFTLRLDRGEDFERAAKKLKVKPATPPERWKQRIVPILIAAEFVETVMQNTETIWGEEEQCLFQSRVTTTIEFSDYATDVQTLQERWIARIWPEARKILVARANRGHFPQRS